MTCRVVFVCSEDTPSAAERRLIIERYALASFLDPNTRYVVTSRVSQDIKSGTEALLRRRMQAVLQPSKAELEQLYSEYMEARGARCEGQEGEADGEVQRASKRFRGPMPTVDFDPMELVDMADELNGEVGGSAGGDEGEAGVVGSQGLVATPDEIFRAIIDYELAVYKSQPKVASGTDALAWWRERKGQLPVMSIVAAAVLSKRATSGTNATQSSCLVDLKLLLIADPLGLSVLLYAASVERIFSQSGLICTALRGALKPATLATLLYTKINWSDDLLQLSYEKVRHGAFVRIRASSMPTRRQSVRAGPGAHSGVVPRNSYGEPPGPPRPWHRARGHRGGRCGVRRGP
jgi:hypothetical protein